MNVCEALDGGISVLLQQYINYYVESLETYHSLIVTSAIPSPISDSLKGTTVALCRGTVVCKSRAVHGRELLTTV